MQVCLWEEVWMDANDLSHFDFYELICYKIYHKTTKICRKIYGETSEWAYIICVANSLNESSCSQEIP